MTTTDEQGNTPPGDAGGKRIGIGKLIFFGILGFLLAVWIALPYLLPTKFTPVSLDRQEQITLNEKVKSLHLDLKSSPDVNLPQADAAAIAPVTGDKTSNPDALPPEKYSEAGAAHEVVFTQREINALIATNTDLGSRVAIDLSPGLISALVMVPLDPAMPVMGGKSVRITAGLEVGEKDGKPVIALKGVSLWGVALPNSWVGDLKNVDMVHEYGDEGFWKSFSAGVAGIVVGDGIVTIKLKE